MSDRVIIDRVILSEWLEKAFMAGWLIDSDDFNDAAWRARDWWVNHRDQVQSDLENHSLVLPYENRRANHGD